MIDLLTSLLYDPNYDNAKANRWGAILTAHHRDDAEETIDEQKAFDHDSDCPFHDNRARDDGNRR